jgi:hypothetical protein
LLRLCLLLQQQLLLYFRNHSVNINAQSSKLLIRI